ncbi:G-protein coupled receptor Mth2-like [Epargyreus clarus]|uniref:G-protein coupled receptor Mth2-like n=1 Tax=Epargyreus clarus TaxID=520877 RepID=UPI003C2AC2CB
MFRHTFLVLIILNTGDFLGNVRSENIKKIKIPKCCLENQILQRSKGYKCILSQKDITTNSFSNIPVYDNIYTLNIERTFNDLFSLESSMKPDNANLKNYLPSMRAHLFKNGDLFLEKPNEYQRWLPVNNKSHFCVEFDSETFASRFYFSKHAYGVRKANTQNFSWGLFISSVFLFLVLVVYMLLPHLRNLSGKVLISYVFSLLVAFLSQGILTQIIRPGIRPSTCMGLGTTIYCSFLASFCWMNVMSYDIWWTFRGYAKARKIHRRGKTFKFCMYSLYAWGIPLVMAIAYVCINKADLRDKPWIIKPVAPNECYMRGGAKLLYFFVPMLILIICNWMFFLMTAFNIWRLHRATAVLDTTAAGTPTAHRSQKQRFFIYLKLSVVMGVSWILEAISSLKPELGIWYISDWYNALIGVSIFLIFVCKRKIYNQLKERLSRWYSRSNTKTSCDGTSISSKSLEAPNEVQQNPVGTNVKALA